MKQIYRSKAHWAKLFVFSIMSLGLSQAQAQTGGEKMSVKNEKWQKGGLFEGYSPSQEILGKRSRTTKQFLNQNGSITSQISGMIHYKDNSGYWQDIDYSITKNLNQDGYIFSNETNEYKSYFPQFAGSKAVKFKLDEQLTLNWWKNPKLEFTVNGNVVKSFAMSSERGNSNKNSIKYHNVYPNITEEFEVIPGGLENNTIISSLTPEMNALPANAMLNFSQTIELKPGWKIMVNDKAQSTNFSSKSFRVEIPGFSDGLTFSPIFVYDNTLTKEQAMALVFSPKEKLTAAQLNQLNSHVYQCDYKATFTNDGLQITTILPLSWLKNSVRSFPVTIDPIVTIGTVPGTGDFRCPISHWYGFQRHADLYLQSEIGGYGLIESIEFYKTSGGARTKPTKVYFRDTPATTLSGTAAWNSSTYTGGLTPSFDGMTTQSAGTGWQMVTLTDIYSYASGNLLLMIYDAYGGGGSAQYFTETEVAGRQRQAFNRVDTNDPGDGAATAVENYLPAIRITYVNPNPPTVDSFTPSAGCTSSGTVVITGTNFSGVSAVTIGGTPVASYTVNNATQITAIVGSGTTGVISVTTPAGTGASTNSFTVNNSPVVAAISGGAASVCANGTTPAFTNATTGGTWGVTNGTGSATIDNGGVVSGATSGIATVTYTVSDGTCSTTVNASLSVTSIPSAVSIAGLISPACSNRVQTLTSNGGTINSIYINESFDGATLPAGWVATPGPGDTITISNTNTAGGNANEVRITGNSQNNIVTDRVAYGPIDSSGLTSLELQWDNFLYNYQVNPYTFTIKIQTSSDGTTWHDTDWVHTPTTNSNIGPGQETTTISTTDVGSSTLYIAFTVTGRTFGFHRWSFDNVYASGQIVSAITWSPTTGLYTDANATVPYTGTATTTVYAKPATTTTYTVTATNLSGCTRTASSEIQVNQAPALPVGTSPQTFTAGQTIADLVVTGTDLQWYSDANATISIPTSTVLADGITYYVTQTENGCRSDILPILADNPLGNITHETSGFTLYPNPVKNVLNLSYNKNISKIQVINLLGQEILTKSINNTEGQVDMSNIASGTYLVKVTADNQVKTIKVIKE